MEQSVDVTRLIDERRFARRLPVEAVRARDVIRDRRALREPEAVFLPHRHRHERKARAHLGLRDVVSRITGL